MEKRLPRIKALLTPGEVAKRSGVAVSALHFYESKGLIKSIRNGGNQRRYTRDVLRYVAIIKIAQRIGSVSLRRQILLLNRDNYLQKWQAGPKKLLRMLLTSFPSFLLLEIL